jgi:hypothetical protein
MSKNAAAYPAAGARSKSSIALKGSSINNSPRPTTAKEKPALLSRRA